MEKRTFINAIMAMAVSALSCEISSAATLSLDLDPNTLGIQAFQTLNPGGTYEFDVVYTGDGITQFDTFAMDVIYNSIDMMGSVDVSRPVAGTVASSAPLMALDLYSGDMVNSADSLTQGSMPLPLGYEAGLGGVGIASVGGSPFSLVGENETVTLFSVSFTLLGSGTGELELTGYPFGVGAELSLAGESVDVSLEGAEIAVVPLPAAVWLFLPGVLGVLGFRRSANSMMRYSQN
jgi:hypothetical protein